MRGDNLYHRVDDEFGHPEKGQWQKRSAEAECDPEADHPPARLPNDLQDERNVADSLYPFCPAVPVSVRGRHQFANGWLVWRFHDPSSARVADGLEILFRM